MEFLIFCGILLLIFAIVLYHVLGPCFRQRDYHSNVPNCGAIGEYHFLLEADEQDLFDKLAVQNIYDEPRFTFDRARRVITFYVFDSETPCSLSFFCRDGHTYMKVTVIRPFSSKYILTMNEFWIRKVNAVPVPPDLFPQNTKKTSRAESR